MNLRARASRLSDRLQSAIAYSLSSPRRAALTAFIAVLTYALLVLSTYPGMTLGMLSDDPRWLGWLVVTLTETTINTNGVATLALIVVYAALTGAAVLNAAVQARVAGLSNASDAVSVIPGLVASGCASCGAGLLGFLGFAGALTVMPFHGDLLRVGGLLLLVYFLARAGDPRHCRLA